MAKKKLKPKPSSNAKAKTQKKLHPKSEKKRTASTSKIRSRKQTKKSKAKPVSKTSKVHKRGTVRKLRIDSRPKTSTKSSRSFETDTKGRKDRGKVSGRTGTAAVEELKVTRKYRTDKEGKRIMQQGKFTVKGEQKTFNVGYRENFEVDLSGGTLNDKIEKLRSADLSFLNKPLNKFNPTKGKFAKAPQAVVIKIITKAGEEVYYSGGISDPDFVVNKDNIRQLVIERINEYKDNWINRVSGKFATGVESIKGKKRQTSKRKKAAAEASQRMEEESGTFGVDARGGPEGEEGESGYKAIFDPNNISGISLSFIY